MPNANNAENNDVLRIDPFTSNPAKVKPTNVKNITAKTLTAENNDKIKPCVTGENKTNHK